MSRPLWLWLIFIVSTLAMLGSLYFWYFGDPVKNLASGEFFNPDNALAICVLCRYTRIATYPIVLISALGLIRRDTSVWVYILPLVIVGLVVSLYQNAIIIIPTITSGVCDINNPCTIGYLNWRWFITIPLLALASLFTILGASIYGSRSTSRTHDSTAIPA